MAYVRFNITVIRRRKLEPADIESLSLDVVHVTAHQVKVNLQSSKPHWPLLKLMYNSRQEIFGLVT